MASLYQIKELGRKFVDVRREYEIRRVAQRVLNGSDETQFVRIHSSARKAGSQFLRLVLSDPRVCLAGQMLPYFFENDPSEGWRKVAEVNRPMICAYYGPPDEIDAHVRTETRKRIIYAGREPEACFRSWLRSTLYAHPNTHKMPEFRSRLNAIDRELERSYYLIEAYKENDALVSAWLAECAEGNARFVPFEHLVSDAPYQAAITIAEGLDLEIKPEKLSKLMVFYGDTVKKSGGKYTSKKKDDVDPKFVSQMESAMELYRAEAKQLIGAYASASERFLALAPM